jgi:hypothetical protein
MSALSENSIQRIAATQEQEDWWTPPAKPVESVPNPAVAACRGQPLLKHVNRVQWPLGRSIHLSQVQIQLGMIAPNSQRFEAKVLPIGKPPFDKSYQQTSVRQVERVLRGHSKCTLDMQESFFRAPIAEEF